jgi:hypothetical protein
MLTLRVTKRPNRTLSVTALALDNAQVLAQARYHAQAVAALVG